MDIIFVFKQYIFLASTFLSIYFVGHIVHSLIDDKIKSHGVVFQKLLIGMVIISSLYAVIKSNGHTIMLINILIIISTIFLSYKMKPSKSNFKKNLSSLELKELSIIFIATSVFYVLQLNTMFDLGNGNIKLIDKDYSFYARLAGYLRDFGIENTNLEYFLADKGGVIPYHYADLWFTALISKTFFIHVQYALILITYPIIFTIVFSGWVYIIKLLKEKFTKKITWLDYLIPLLFFTLSMFKGIYPSYINLLKMDIWTPTILSMPKLAIIYPFILFILINLYEKKYFMVSVTACIIASVYTTVSVSVFLALGIFFLINFLLKKETIKNTILYISPMILTSFFVVIFYYFFGETSPTTISLSDIANIYSSIDGVKTFFNIFIKGFFQIIATSLPFILLFLFTRKYYNKNAGVVLNFSIILIVVSVSMWAFTHMMHDSVQLWTNIYIPLINTLVFFFIIILWVKSSKTNIYRYLTLGLLFICLIYIHNPINSEKAKITFIDFKRKELLFTKEPRIAFIKKSNDYVNHFEKLEQVYSGGVYTLMRMIDPLYIVCLSPNSINIENINEQNFVQKMTFSKYTNLISDTFSDTKINNNEMQLMFIEKYNINYLLVNKKRPLSKNFLKLFNPSSIGTIDGFSIHNLKH